MPLRLRRRALLRALSLTSFGLGMGPLLAACDERAFPATDPGGRTDFAAPFALVASSGVRPLWTVDRGGQIGAPSVLHLPVGAAAVSPWIDSTPGARYQVRVSGSGAIHLAADWGDLSHRPLRSDAWTARTDGATTITAPANAGGFRLRLSADTGDATVRAISLVLAGGVRVEPFPDYAVAAFAFSYDWESAMGGLVHTRSIANGEGSGTLVSLQANGGPDLAEVEAKALRMRDGARFLAERFAYHGIRATFYATGYNLLTGNPTKELFVGNPVYPNADVAHGWGSDWWRTHPWYGEDPYGTEETAPAWYFASLTRELAGAGHEIASHTFGHLYVRGVKPEQLAADLAQWQRAAEALGIAPAPTFAFPWTSSNSLDGRFWSVFARMGWTTVTRLYPPDLRHPYELDHLAADPRLAVFPDFYLPSRSGMAAEGLARVEEVLARRGYTSLWTHPNEVLQQDGPGMWTAVIAGVAAARDRGLWVAPIAEIARYAAATRLVATELTDGGRRIAVENGGSDPLTGLTLTLPRRVRGVAIDGRVSTDVRGDRVRLPALGPGARITLRLLPGS